MAASVSAPVDRARNPDFVQVCNFSKLRDRLPLQWPVPLGVPPSPKRTYRSHYVYLGCDDLQDPQAWEHLSHFDVVLRLIDFSGLRPVLAQRLGWTCGRGHKPFDPVSMFLLQGWQIVNSWSRADTLKNLADPRYDDYRERFGFEKGIYPTEGGLRYFLTALGHHSDARGDTVRVELKGEPTVEVAIQYLNQLLVGAVRLLQEANLFNAKAWTQALVCPDGMLHDAKSRMRCSSVQESCYQPTSPEAPRPCPAKEKEKRGCDCDELACADACRYATPRDADARFVYYSGSNQPHNSPNRPQDESKARKGQGRICYGYRSLPLLLADPIHRFHATLLQDFRAANDREEVPAAALLLQLPLFYPDLHLDAVVGDAGFGFDVFLHTIYRLKARRVVDLRAHETDKDKSQWPVRGYDDKGRPICPFGYAFTANGFDTRRQRYKWYCGKACQREDAQPVVYVKGADYPPAECPHQEVSLPHGKILNIDERFRDGSIRLVRDVPFGSTMWKTLYHRARNASEGRNATHQHWDVKRLPVYGQYRAKAFSFLTETWSTLTKLARLVREATFADTN
jgi:hypothetical protein